MSPNIPAMRGASSSSTSKAFSAAGPENKQQLPSQSASEPSWSEEAQLLLKGIPSSPFRREHGQRTQSSLSAVVFEKESSSK